MTLVFLSDALSLASIKAAKEDRRYCIEAVRRPAGDYGWTLRPANLNDFPSIYVEPDGTVIKKSEVSSK